jgi:hypothetical protein
MNRLTAFFCPATALALLLAFPTPALAATCITDMDCPTTACGGQVCQWLSTTDHECQDAGSKSHGSDGWCNTVADCKCQSVGAKCNAQFSCSFTLPADAPPAGGAGGMSGAGAGGMSGAGAGGMSGAGAGGMSGAGAGGAAGGSGGTVASGGDTTSGGQSAGTGGTPVASGGTTSTTPTAGTGDQTPDGPIMGSPSAPDSGGCALSTASTRANGWLGFIFLGVALLFARRQRTG